MAKYSAAFKLEVAKAYFDGPSSYTSLSCTHGVDRSKVRLWVKLYEAHGAEGLAKKFTHYSAAFKLSILQRMWTDGLSFYDTAAVFNIRNPSCLAQWERLYRQGGIEALEPRKRRRPEAMSDPKGKPPPERPDTERSQEELIAELKQLRMENAYLKKLDALVRVRQAPKGRK